MREEPVTYKDGDTTLHGFVVYEDSKQGKRPGIVVLHEWWGITEHVMNEARHFASEGYTAFVADLYAGKTADNPADATALMNGLMGNPALVASRFEAARAQLAKHATVDASRLGATGYCMGGKIALDMARAGAGLKAVASFHGNLTPQSPAQAGKVQAKVIAMNGADDPFVSADSIVAFRKEMEAAKVDYKFINYPGAVHAFTNPDATEKGKKFNLPLAYNADADRQSKADAGKFFAEAFR
jgi:dienelactone hydrolase